MISDANKQIMNISYTHQNLPRAITIGGDAEHRVCFLYDATGRKIRKQTLTNQAINATTDYVGSFVYENNVLQYILTAEGRVVLDGPYARYQYFLKDHLGNTRVVFDDAGVITQDNSYYPFGMVMSGLDYDNESYAWSNKYLYNGKEFQDDFGLDWYDYGARFYDPAIGRWHSVDLRAEKYPHLNPYMYCLNNPIRLVDPDGKEPTLDEAVALVKHINSYFNSEVKLLGGWKLDKPYDDRKQSGFTGGMYFRVKEDGSTEYAFVTRGSDLDFSKEYKESTLKDWKNNFDQIFSGITEQYKISVGHANRISESLNDKELTFVGQSLGGGLASANALATGRRGITFNAAGLSDKTIQELSLNNKDANITSWIIKGEIVDYLQSLAPGINQAYGRRVELMPAIPYIPGITLPLKALQIYQRIQNHFIEAFD